MQNLACSPLPPSWERALGRDGVFSFQGCASSMTSQRCMVQPDVIGWFREPSWYTFRMGEKDSKFAVGSRALWAKAYRKSDSWLGLPNPTPQLGFLTASCRTMWWFWKHQSGGRVNEPLNFYCESAKILTGITKAIFLNDREAIKRKCVHFCWCFVACTEKHIVPNRLDCIFFLSEKHLCWRLHF